MALKKITEKQLSDNLKEDASLVVTQKEVLDGNGNTGESLRRIPLEIFMAFLGTKLDLSGLADQIEAFISEYHKKNPAMPAISEMESKEALSLADTFPYQSSESGTMSSIEWEDIIGAIKAAITYVEKAGYTTAMSDGETAYKATIPQLSGNSTLALLNDVTSHNISETAHNDIRLLIEGLTSRLNAIADSDDTTLDQLSELVAYIKDNRELIEQITTGKVSVADIVNDLVTNVASKPLSAAQGVVLKDLIDELDSSKLDESKLGEAVDAALAEAKESGEFDGKPGLSPYEVAVENGFEGTEEEWLESLKATANLANNTSPLMDGEAKIGTSPEAARADHVHPTDTTRMPSIIYMNSGSSLTSIDSMFFYSPMTGGMCSILWSEFYPFLENLILTKAKESGEFGGSKWFIGTEIHANESDIWVREDFTGLASASESTVMIPADGTKYSISYEGFFESAPTLINTCLRFDSDDGSSGYLSFFNELNEQIKSAGGCTVLFDLYVENTYTPGDDEMSMITLFAGGTGHNHVLYDFVKKAFIIAETDSWVQDISPDSFTVKAEYPVELELGKWYAIGVEFDGASAAVYLNGVKLFASPFTNLCADYIIFYPQRCTVRFDNIRLCGKDYSENDNRTVAMRGQKAGDFHLNTDNKYIYKLLSTGLWENQWQKLE